MGDITILEIVNYGVPDKLWHLADYFHQAQKQKTLQHCNGQIASRQWTKNLHQLW